MNVVSTIRSFNTSRDPDRLAMKYQAMRANVFGFMRGTCHLYFARLPRSGPMKTAPLAWICGDLHLANFGSYKADNRLVYFDINDFDESALAPASWDLVRLLSSVTLAAGAAGQKDGETRQLCQTLVDTYAAELAAGKAYWVERDTARGLVGDLLEKLRTRQRPDFLSSRTKMKGRRRVLDTDNGKALPASGEQKKAVRAFMADLADKQANPRFFEVLDVARRIAGTGSLGVERFVILVRGKGSPDGNYLLDLKRTLPSSWCHLSPAAQPRWASQAHRVVAVQQRMQAVSAAFLQPVQFGAQPFVLRALHPSEDRVDLEKAGQSADDLKELVTTAAQVTAWAHLRSAARQGAATPDELIDYGLRHRWRAKLQDIAEAAALQVRKDAAVFNSAFDAGEFAQDA